MSHRICLLDTSVILPLVRGNALGKHIDQRFGLQASAQRPFVSVVSLGEVRVLAKRNDWGEAKLQALSSALDNLVVVDINHPAVIDAYVELDLVSRRAILTVRATWERTTCGSLRVPRRLARPC